MSDNVNPEENDLVKVEFDPVNGTEDSHNGEVLDVDTDPDAPGCEVRFTLTDGDRNTVVEVAEGHVDGDYFCNVHRISDFRKPVEIGENAEWEIVS